MLVRVVKMAFKTDAVEVFKKFFEEKKDKIRNFEGAPIFSSGRLIYTHTNIFFTYSH